MTLSSGMRLEFTSGQILHYPNLYVSVHARMMVLAGTFLNISKNYAVQPLYA